MRLFAGIAMGLAFAWGIHSRAQAENVSSIAGKGQKYLPHVAGYILPMFLILLHISGRIILGADYTRRTMLSMCFTLFLHISVYYAILLPLLPYLRKRISSRACATLWLIPNYLYLTQQDAMAVSAPLLVINAPGNLVRILMGIWFAGFAGVLIWKIISHVRFRRQLLKSAEECPDPAVRQQWKRDLADGQIKTEVLTHDFDLIVSGNGSGLLCEGYVGAKPGDHIIADTFLSIFFGL